MTNFSYIPEHIYTGGQPYFIIVEGAVTEYRDRVAESIAELLPGEYLRDVHRDWPGYKELLYLVRERIPVILSGSHFLLKGLQSMSAPMTSNHSSDTDDGVQEFS
jgi:hypothetical protein